MSSGTTTAAARVRYVPLERRRRQGGEYAARRAQFLQSYRFSVDGGRREEEDVVAHGGRRGRLARRLREAVARARWCVGAGLARAWRGWRPRGAHPLLGCFGPAHRHHKYYLRDYV